MGFLSFVGSVISGAGSFISSCAGALGKFATGALNVLKVGGPWVGPICTAVSHVAKILGTLKNEDKVNELGAKAMMPEAKNSEDFQSTSEYIDHLRNEIKLDREKFEKSSNIEKAAHLAVGTSIVIKAIDEKNGFTTPVEAWRAFCKLGLENKAKDINIFCNEFKDGRFSDFAKYVDGKLEGFEKNEEIADSIAKAYQELEPNSSAKEIEEKVMAAQKGDIPPPKTEF